MMHPTQKGTEMERFPYPSRVKVVDSVTLKLCSTNYFPWKEQMLKFLAGHKLSGFVSMDSTYNRPTKPESWELDDTRWKEERQSKLREDWGQKDMWLRDWEQELKRQEAAYCAGERELERERERWEAEWEGRESQETEWKRERREAEWNREREKLKREREKLEREREKLELELELEWERERQERQSELEKARSKYEAWKRSDDLVSKWILETVTKEIQLQVTNLGTARDVWIKISKILAQPFQLSHLEQIDWTDNKRRQTLSKYVVLHKTARTGDWATAAKFLDRTPGAALEPITWRSETALIVAIRSAKRNNFVRKLMLRMSWESEKAKVPQQQLLAERDISGATALHAAVGGGNIVAAKWLVEMNSILANIKDKHGTLAVHVAAGLGNRDMVDFLLKHYANPSESESGGKLLHSLASSGLYDIALTFLQKNPNLASTEPSPLVVMAQKRTSFLSGTKLNFVQHLLYSGIPLKLKDISNQSQERDIEDPTRHVISAPNYVRQKLNACWNVAEKLVPPIKSVRKTKLIHHQALDLVKCLCEEVVKDDLVNAAEILAGPLRIATCAGIHEIVEEILSSFPSAIHMRNEKDQSLFHLAIVHRRENVFNLIYQMEEDPRAFLSMPDASTSNALHSAGDLGEQQLLLIRESAAGAALQMQRELQWFKEVGKVVLPQAKELMNADGQTPQEVFTKTHKDLVKEGEKWMKDTANSCSIVAVLITTIVFAAAITVPGGSNTNTGLPTSGLPILSGERAFTVFLVSDALALFSSSASLIMFLSILTSRYAEQDFLRPLPKRMIIGLMGLFLSIISMMVAFGATLKIVSGEKKAWIIICVAVLSGLPVILFALLQFPLLLLMIKSTYGQHIFKKQSNRIML